MTIGKYSSQIIGIHPLANYKIPVVDYTNKNSVYSHPMSRNTHYF